MRKHLVDIINSEPSASLTKNKYKVLCGMLKRMFPDDYEKIPREKWLTIAHEIVNGDREWRKLTEGKDKENKERLEQEWKIKNGYDPMYHSDIKLTKKI